MILSSYLENVCTGYCILQSAYKQVERDILNNLLASIYTIPSNSDEYWNCHFGTGIVLMSHTSDCTCALICGCMANQGHIL